MIRDLEGMGGEGGPVPVLDCRAVSFAYADRIILNNFSLVIGAGETLAVLGRSGSGKTTALKTINLLLRPGAGTMALHGQSYFVDGETLFEPREIRSRIGFVAQAINLFPNMRVMRNMTLAVERVRGLSRGEAEDAARQIAASMGIDDLLNRFPDQLSGGQAQRVALARALMMRPDVLLLDEITSALDPETAHEVFLSIQGARQSAFGADTAIIMVTHSLSFALDVATRISFLKDGSLVETWPASEFVSSVQEPDAKRYIRDLQHGASN